MKTQFTMMFAGLVVLGFVVSTIAAPRDTNLTSNAVQSQSAASQQTVWQYARLFVQVDEVTWQAGESNVEPRAYSVGTLYKQLGGRSRPSLTNLLNQIGTDGWELVGTDETNWTFKRRQ